jgi:hypothetical protein
MRGATRFEKQGAVSIRRGPAALVTGSPQRPGADILSPSIPLFFIGRNKDGFWFALEEGSSRCGLFMTKWSALRFARSSVEPSGWATMFVSQALKLDPEVPGKTFVSLAVRGMRLLQRARRCWTGSRTKCI